VADTDRHPEMAPTVQSLSEAQCLRVEVECLAEHVDSSQVTSSIEK